MRAFDLVNLGLMIAAAVAAAGLLVALAEGILERRRSLAALIAAGAPVSTLRRAVVLQGLLPLVPAVLLATSLGGLMFLAINRLTPGSVGAGAHDPSFPITNLALIALAGVAASALAAALSLPFLNRSVRPSELRFE